MAGRRRLTWRSGHDHGLRPLHQRSLPHGEPGRRHHLRLPRPSGRARKLTMADIVQPRPVLPPASGALTVRLRRLGEVTVQTLRNPVTVIGLVIIVLMFAMALLAPVLTTPN